MVGYNKSMNMKINSYLTLSALERCFHDPSRNILACNEIWMKHEKDLVRNAI